MSAWTRLAVLAAGAAAGVGAGRAAGSDRGRRALAQAVERGRGALEPAEQDQAGPWRENRLGTRVLRLAQDIRSGMDQAETELREQLGRPARPSPAEGRLSARDAARHEQLPGARADEQTIIEHDEQAPVEGSGGGS